MISQLLSVVSSLFPLPDKEKGAVGKFPRTRSYEWLYLTALVLAAISIFPDNAAAPLLFNYGEHIIDGSRILRHAAAILALTYYALTLHIRTPHEHIAFIVCFATTRLSLLNSGHPTIFWAIIYVFCAKGVDFKKIVSVHTFTVVSLLLAYFLLAARSLVPSFDYPTINGIRHSFGSVYPTDFAAHIFYIALSLAYLRRHHLNLFDIALNCGLAWFCMSQCIARSASICLLALAALCAYVFAKRQLTREVFTLSTVGYALSVATCIFCCLFVLLASWFFTYDSPSFVKLDGLLSTRLSLGRKAFDILSITPFGQSFEMIGNGGYMNTAGLGEYFYLDSWYMQALMYWGVACILMCIVGCVVICYRAYRAQDHLIPLLLVLVCIHCITDQYLTNYCYNFLMFAVTANLSCTKEVLPTCWPFLPTRQGDAHREDRRGRYLGNS